MNQTSSRGPSSRKSRRGSSDKQSGQGGGKQRHSRRNGRRSNPSNQSGRGQKSDHPKRWQQENADRSESLPASAKEETLKLLAELRRPASGNNGIEPVHGTDDGRGQQVQGAARDLASEAPPHLDPWQRQVLERLTQGDHVIVDAPTTAGKTRAVETYFAENIGKPGFRACYTTPVKSLANDKLREFRELFGKEAVGLSTGEIKENLHAPVVVATLESYRNTLIGVEPDLGRQLVVFDEYHYIQDSARGSAWEESIILTPQNCQVLMLSASVANPGDFKEWLENIKEKPVELISVQHRPVPLEDMTFADGTWVSNRFAPGLKRRQDNGNVGRSRMRQSLDMDRLAAALAEASRMQLTPTIVYCAKRLTCEELARFVAPTLPFIDRESSRLIKNEIDRAISESEGQITLSAELEGFMLDHGLAFHHSGMAAGTRFLVETLLKDGRLQFCFATMGLSLGINFAVRSTLISDFSRPSEDGPISYPMSEVLQMSGRAGRRGRDRVGFTLWLSPMHFQMMGDAKREPCHSRLRNDPTTYLGLIGKGKTPDDIMDFYSQSLRKFQQRKIDLSLITPGRLQKKLRVARLPCQSPAYEFAMEHRLPGTSRCPDCDLRRDCHAFLRSKLQGDLTKLQLHLAGIGATDENDRLTHFGEMARFFPQSGGLLIAKYLAKDTISPTNLAEALQLCAALATAFHKKPGATDSYVFPWDEEKVMQDLRNLYPYEIFPELYERPRFRPLLTFREWNPTAGCVVRELFRGRPWEEIVALGTSDTFGEGDLLNLILRVATYLRSIKASADEAIRHDVQYLEESVLAIPTFLS